MLRTQQIGKSILPLPPEYEVKAGTVPLRNHIDGRGIVHAYDRDRGQEGIAIIEDGDELLFTDPDESLTIIDYLLSSTSKLLASSSQTYRQSNSERLKRIEHVARAYQQYEEERWRQLPQGSQRPWAWLTEAGAAKIGMSGLANSVIDYTPNTQGNACSSIHYGNMHIETQLLYGDEIQPITEEAQEHQAIQNILLELQAMGFQAIAEENLPFSAEGFAYALSVPTSKQILRWKTFNDLGCIVQEARKS